MIVLINGVESSLDDLQTLPQEMVGKVEISTIVPSKYGSHVAAVIDVRTRLVNHGYAFGANAMNALTTSYNDDGAWAKYFHRNATLGLQYNFKANDVTKAFAESHQNFSILTDILVNAQNRKLAKAMISAVITPC